MRTIIVLKVVPKSRYTVEAILARRLKNSNYLVEPKKSTYKLLTCFSDFAKKYFLQKKTFNKRKIKVVENRFNRLKKIYNQAMLDMYTRHLKNYRLFVDGRVSLENYITSRFILYSIKKRIYILVKNFVFIYYSNYLKMDTCLRLLKFYSKNTRIIIPRDFPHTLKHMLFFSKVIKRGANANKPEKFRVNFIKELAHSEAFLGYDKLFANRFKARVKVS